MFGGVGMYIHHDITNVKELHTLKLTTSCNCSRCEVESLFMQLTHKGTTYVLGGIYRHPNGNTQHFTDDLEKLCTNLNKGITTILAGDINIDLIKFHEPNTLNYLTTLLSERFLPHITLPTRITSHSATCIDHVFVREPNGTQNSCVYKGILYSDISDHLPCIAMFKTRRLYNTNDRPMTRLFGKRNIEQFIQRMAAENWDRIYMPNVNSYLAFIETVIKNFKMSFPLVRVSRSKMKYKPWLTKGLKIVLCGKTDYTNSLLQKETILVLKHITNTKIYCDVALKPLKLNSLTISSTTIKNRPSIYGKASGQ